MSDLPSRDWPTQYSVQEATEICNAWRSGRLVDREAIDWGEMQHQIWRDTATKLNRQWLERAFAAAIGDTK